MTEQIFEGYVFRYKSWFPNNNDPERLPRSEEEAGWNYSSGTGSTVNPAIYTTEKKALASSKYFGKWAGWESLGDNLYRCTLRNPTGITGDVQFMRGQALKVKVVSEEPND